MPIPDEVKKNICLYADQVLAVLLPILGPKPIIALAIKIAVATFCGKPLSLEGDVTPEDAAEAQAIADRLLEAMESVQACDEDGCDCG